MYALVGKRPKVNSQGGLVIGSGRGPRKFKFVEKGSKFYHLCCISLNWMA